jgi:hypothetical protein
MRSLAITATLGSTRGLGGQFADGATGHPLRRSDKLVEVPGLRPGLRHGGISA